MCVGTYGILATVLYIKEELKDVLIRWKTPDFPALLSQLNPIILVVQWGVYVDRKGQNTKKMVPDPLFPSWPLNTVHVFLA